MDHQTNAVAEAVRDAFSVAGLTDNAASDGISFRPR